MPFSASQAAAIQGAVYFGDVSSIAGCIFVVITYLLFKEQRNLFNRLVLWYSVSIFILDSIALTFSLAGHRKDGPVCYFQALNLTYFNLTSWCWIACISFGMYLMIVWRMKLDEMRVEKYFHLFAWGLPLILTAVAASTDVIGDVGPWCWIKPKYTAMRFGVFYGINIAIFFFNTVMLALVGFYIRKVAKNASKDFRNEIRERKAQIKLVLYSLIFFLCWGWGVALRIHDSLNPKNPIFWLTWIHTFMSISHGFFTSIVYTINSKVLASYKRLFLNCWRETGRKGSMSQELFPSDNTTHQSSSSSSDLYVQSDLQGVVIQREPKIVPNY